MQLYRAVFIFTIFFLIAPLDGQTVKIGKNDYSLQTYKEEYTAKAQLKFLILKPFFRKYFTDTTDTAFTHSLNRQWNDTSKYTGTYVSIEPLIINTSCKDGLYSTRGYPKKGWNAPRFLDGFPHYVFLISDNHVFWLNNIYEDDTLKPDKIIDSCSKHLLTLFSERDIRLMKMLADRRIWWTDMVQQCPYIVYKGKKVYLDVRPNEDLEDNIK